MTPPGIEVRPLGRSSKDYGDAGVVGARAFHNDPFFEFLSPRPIMRARGLAIFCQSYVATIGDRGVVLGARQADGRLVGVAAWIKPGCFPLPVPTQLRQLGGSLRALAFRPRALVDGSRYLLAIDHVHPRDKHWYLQLLVVDPSVQRRGIGGLLQQPGLERADRDGVPCYLETQKRENLAYYGRFGYEVVKELSPVENGPPLWTMLRQPKAPDA